MWSRFFLVLLSLSYTHQETPRIWLTINAEKNLLEVSWENAPALSGDKISVQQQDSTYTFNAGSKSSRLVTNVKYNYNWFYDFDDASRCYDFLTTYQDVSGRVIAGTCCSVYPTWMRTLGTHISHRRLRDLFIPGTHYSGAYLSALIPTQDLITYGYLDTFEAEYYDILAKDFAVTQDEDLWRQLMHGARYLDLRVGYIPYLPEEYYIMHGPVLFSSFQHVIDQVKRFVIQTNEVVILGMSDFPEAFNGPHGFGVHMNLVEFLRQGFQGLIVNPSLNWNANLQQIWNTNRSIILAYDEPDIVLANPDILFHGVTQFQGRKRVTNELITYLQTVINLNANRQGSLPMAAVATLTPTIATEIAGGRNLRGMADEANPSIDALFKGDLGKISNIVAADFIRGTNLIQIAIDLNLRKNYYVI